MNLEVDSLDNCAYFKKVFSLVDTDGDGLINHDELALMFRALGQCPTEREMTRALNGSYSFMASFS
jgi:Ca2+-binding EF-hand superfamily protein